MFAPKALLRNAIRFAQRLGVALKRRGWGSSSLSRIGIDALLWPSDVLTARSGYYASFSRMPRLLRPQTLNEILQHNKLFQRKRRHTMMADKIAVRNYVADRVGSEMLSKLYWTGSDLDLVARESLPKTFVLKANHGCDMNLMVTDRDALNWCRAADQARRWLETDYSLCSAEWQYRWIRPALLIEELLLDAGGQLPLDYKFFCLHGRVECVQIDFGRHDHHTRAFVDRDFAPLNLTLLYPRHEGLLELPGTFDAMVDVAETLASGERFVRVDLYDVGRPMFGEMTLSPGAGKVPFEPETYDQALGERLRRRPQTRAVSSKRAAVRAE